MNERRARGRNEQTNERTMNARAGRIRRARHVRRRRRRRGRRDEPVRSSDADADAGRGEPVRGERERRRRWERKSLRDAVRTGDDDAGVAVRAAVDVGVAVRTAVDVGVDAVRTAVDVDAVRVDVVRGRGRERGRGVVAVRAAELGGGGVVAVRASERRSVAVRTERGGVVAVRSDEWCVRFDVRIAVRRWIELAFRRERADADSVRNDDIGARRCEPVRVWWHRGGVAIWIFERAERADEFTVRRCAPNRRRGVAVFGQACRARDTSVGRWF